MLVCLYLQDFSPTLQILFLSFFSGGGPEVLRGFQKQNDAIDGGQKERRTVHTLAGVAAAGSCYHRCLISIYFHIYIYVFVWPWVGEVKHFEDLWKTEEKSLFEQTRIMRLRDVLRRKHVPRVLAHVCVYLWVCVFKSVRVRMVACVYYENLYKADADAVNHTQKTVCNAAGSARMLQSTVAPHASEKKSSLISQNSHILPQLPPQLRLRGGALPEDILGLCRARALSRALILHARMHVIYGAHAHNCHEC